MFAWLSGHQKTEIRDYGLTLGAWSLLMSVLSSWVSTAVPHATMVRQGLSTARPRVQSNCETIELVRRGRTPGRHSGLVMTSELVAGLLTMFGCRADDWALTSLHGAIWQALLRAVCMPMSNVIDRGVCAHAQDEEFHVRQTQTFCSHDFSTWDAKTATFPGLFLLGSLYSNVLSFFMQVRLSCTIAVLYEQSCAGLQMSR